MNENMSRRVYFTATIVMLLVLFMFQFSGVIRKKYNDYDINSYEQLENKNYTAQMVFKVSTNEKEVLSGSNGYVVYIGGQDTDMGKTVTDWCEYTKRNMLIYKDIKEYRSYTTRYPDAVLLDSSYLNYSTDISYIDTLADSGINIVFCNMPDYSTMHENTYLQEICGITLNQERVAITGVKVFEDFLLGGEKWYIPQTEEEQEYFDFDSETEWYVPSGATKTYMIGIADEKLYSDRTNEKQPAIIWKKSYGNSNIFCINADYIEKTCGIGILTAVMYNMNDYLIYPVVDSQSVVVKNYPLLSFDNENEIKQYYGRTSSAVMQNVIWPELYNISTGLDARFTFMVPPQLNYSDNNTPSIQELEYFFRLFKENNYEAGLTTRSDKETTVTEKLKADEDFYNAFMDRYRFLAISARKSEVSEILNADMEYTDNLNTIVTGSNDFADDGLFEYKNQNVLGISSVLSAENYSYTRDFTQKCLNSALAYLNVDMDLEKVLTPDSNSLLWDKYVKKATYSLTGYLENNKYFSKCSITEADKRIREFLALNYTQSRSGDAITINTSGAAQTKRFMIRLHTEEIESVTGGEFVKVEDGVYIVTSDSNQIIVNVRSTR